MANDGKTSPFGDGNGNTSKQVAHIAAATTLANAFLYAQDLAEILDALSDAKVIGAEVLAPVDLSGQDIKTDPTVQSDIESGAKFVFRDHAPPLENIRKQSV